MTDHYTLADCAAQLIGAAQSALTTDDPAGAEGTCQALRALAAVLAADGDPAELIELLALAAGSAVDVSARAAGLDPSTARRQSLAVAELWARLPR